MELVNVKAEQYATQMSGEEEALLKEVSAFTLEHHPKHHMLSGAVQGKLLKMISNMLKPMKILEIGTFTGYSALCLAEGLQENGVLHTIEMRNAGAEGASSFFNKSTLKNKIVLHVGDAHEILSNLNETWDLVFMDADKTGYIDYFETVLPQMKSGGIIIADNVLFHGEVLETPVTGKNALAIDAFNKYVLKDNRVEQMMITLRDGLLLIRKK